MIWNTDDMPKKLVPKIVSLDPNDDNIILVRSEYNAARMNIDLKLNYFI